MKDIGIYIGLFYIWVRKVIGYPIESKRQPLRLKEVLDWCSDVVESEGNIPEEELINDLKEVWIYLYGEIPGEDELNKKYNMMENYYLITHDSFFELVNRYREKMGLPTPIWTGEY